MHVDWIKYQRSLLARLTSRLLKLDPHICLVERVEHRKNFFLFWTFGKEKYASPVHRSCRSEGLRGPRWFHWAHWLWQRNVAPRKPFFVRSVVPPKHVPGAKAIQLKDGTIDTVAWKSIWLLDGLETSQRHQSYWPLFPIICLSEGSLIQCAKGACPPRSDPLQ